MDVVVDPKEIDGPDQDSDGEDTTHHGQRQIPKRLRGISTVDRRGLEGLPRQCGMTAMPFSLLSATAAVATPDRSFKGRHSKKRINSGLSICSRDKLSFNDSAGENRLSSNQP
jgi:hypothetical protein